MTKTLKDYEYYRDNHGVIYLGDCLEIMPLLEENCCKMSFTSPPYNIGNSGKNKNMYTEYDDNLSDIDYFNLLNITTSEAIRICQDFAFVNLNFMKNNIRTILRFLHEGSTNLKDILVWDKMFVQPPIGNILGKRCEYIYIYSKDVNAVLNDFKSNKAEKYKHIFGSWLSNIAQISIKTDKTDNSSVHRAGFPVALPSVFIEMYSEKEDIILEPFMGLGSTCRAAKDLGRRYIGIEIAKKYCDIAVKRLAQEVLF